MRTLDRVVDRATDLLCRNGTVGGVTEIAVGLSPHRTNQDLMRIPAVRG